MAFKNLGQNFGGKPVQRRIKEKTLKINVGGKMTDKQSNLH